jgi:hypothetical protein
VVVAAWSVEVGVEPVVVPGCAHELGVVYVPDPEHELVVLVVLVVPVLLVVVVVLDRLVGVVSAPVVVVALVVVPPFVLVWSQLVMPD